jgi:hypothetical protein
VLGVFELVVAQIADVPSQIMGLLQLSPSEGLVTVIGLPNSREALTKQGSELVDSLKINFHEPSALVPLNVA